MATQSITLCVPHTEMFATARAAASSIFTLLDRKPKIDSMNQGGLSPRRVKGEISLDEVHFSYPSRPDTKVRILLKNLTFFKSIEVTTCLEQSVHTCFAKLTNNNRSRDGSN